MDKPLILSIDPGPLGSRPVLEVMIAAEAEPGAGQRHLVTAVVGRRPAAGFEGWLDALLSACMARAEPSHVTRSVDVTLMAPARSSVVSAGLRL